MTGMIGKRSIDERPDQDLLSPLKEIELQA